MSNNTKIELHLVETNLIKIQFDSNEEISEFDDIKRKNSLQGFSYDKENQLLTCKITDEVTGPFNLKIVFEGVYSVTSNNDATEKDFENLFKNSEQIERICYPLLAESSLLIGTISGKSVGVPLIVRPALEDDKSDNENEE
ncbi:hypothetical protein [Bacillus velezensis]|uniref:hypothetical protein n=1 Tax=Bacillus velezensis TaxID=492670 RepID=UPI002DB70AB8|nr:hypothetical protein [Bacillus velezensis]MEC2287303.1 hypothetical protein [Bacillus velezensis]MEC2422422.1 hypothetical protein [Bacillus velezensis]